MTANTPPGEHRVHVTAAMTQQFHRRVHEQGALRLITTWQTEPAQPPRPVIREDTLLRSLMSFERANRAIHNPATPREEH